MIKNKYFLLIALISSVTFYTQQAQAAQAQQGLHDLSMVLDVTEVILDNFAMAQHTSEPSRSPAVLHAAACFVGLVRNCVEISLVSSDNRPTTNGCIGALTSSIATQLLNLATHSKNAYNKNDYRVVDILSSSGIRGAQLLKLITHYYTHYQTTGIHATAEYLTAKHNIHAALEALEKLLLTRYYTSSIIDTKVTQGALLSSALANGASAGYYLLQAGRANENDLKKLGVFIYNKDDQEVLKEIGDFTCSICLTDKTDIKANTKIIKLPVCKHLLCLECCRDNFKTYEHAELENDVPGVGILRDPNQKAQNRFKERIYECPECRAENSVKDALERIVS